MKKLQMLDLFSGIGGFSLAAHWTGQIETAAFCEINKFAQEVLKMRFPGVPIFDDVRNLNKEKLTDAGIPRIDIICGGFPCQPFSCAGRRAGKSDDRYLWPEMARIIKDFRPTWVIGENVLGIKSLFQYESFSEMEGREYSSKEAAEAGFKGISERTGENCLWMVLDELKKLGYAVQPFVIPACAAPPGAPHRRDRVWIVANSRERQGGERGIQGRGEDKGETCGWTSSVANKPDSDAADSGDAGLQRRKRNGTHEKRQTSYRPATECSGAWERPWLEVATTTCVRGVSYGVSGRLDGFELSASKHREERLKSLGNAIVPQVAYEIFMAMLDAEGLIC